MFEEPSALGETVNYVQSSLEGANADLQSLGSEIKRVQQHLRSRTSNLTAEDLDVLRPLKSILLRLRLLVPDNGPDAAHQTVPLLMAARYVFELGALIAINAQQLPVFTRYYYQLQPFYALPKNRLPSDGSIRNRLTGLYMMHLLTEHDYAGFHSLLEQLEVRGHDSEAEADSIRSDNCIQFPVELEQALMQGTYDKVHLMINMISKSTSTVPLEFGYFSKILLDSIRKEIARSSSRAYTSMPLPETKSLFFFNAGDDITSFLNNTLMWDVDKQGRVFTRNPDDDLVGRTDAMHLDDDGAAGAGGAAGAAAGGAGEGASATSTSLDPMTVNLLHYASVVEAIV